MTPTIRTILFALLLAAPGLSASASQPTESRAAPWTHCTPSAIEQGIGDTPETLPAPQQRVFFERAFDMADGAAC